MNTGLYLLFLVAEGCAPQPEATPAGEAPAPDPTTTWELVPSTLDFGDVPLGTTVESELVLTNTGTTVSDVVQFVAETPSIVLPGQSTPIRATWSPSDAHHIRAVLRLLLTGVDGEGEARGEAKGDGLGAVASLEADQRDFGEVGTGCAAATTVTVANDGDVALNVDPLTMDEGAGFYLQYPVVKGFAIAPPWTLDPGEQKSMALCFTPGELGEHIATLSLVSDDLLAPERSIQFAATVVQAVEVRDSWVIPAASPVEAVTEMVAVNEVVNTTYSEQFQRALPTFFATLQSAGVPYRVAFVGSRDGVADGAVPFLDETITPEESTRLALAIKTDAADLVIYGIGGDVPGGCATAEPFTAIADAAPLTGGLFFSICDEDWSYPMASLALAFMGEGAAAFPLSELPVEEGGASRFMLTACA